MNEEKSRLSFYAILISILFHISVFLIIGKLFITKIHNDHNESILKFTIVESTAEAKEKISKIFFEKPSVKEALSALNLSSSLNQSKNFYIQKNNPEPELNTALKVSENTNEIKIPSVQAKPQKDCFVYSYQPQIKTTNITYNFIL